MTSDMVLACIDGRARSRGGDGASDTRAERTQVQMNVGTASSCRGCSGGRGRGRGDGLRRLVRRRCRLIRLWVLRLPRFGGCRGLPGLGGWCWWGGCWRGRVVGPCSSRGLP